MGVKALKGFKDILPAETPVWQRIESTARNLFHRYGFNEIRVPILEKTRLFTRSIGETTDIVEKEMYTFEDRNGSMLTMRPEGTASVLRAFIEHNLNLLQPVQRLYTIGPMFRHERPQKGRLRQFHQMSVEVLGAEEPMIDAELMAMAWSLVDELGLSVSLEINSLGCPECRPAYNQALVDFLEDRSGALCDDCERRRKTNPLRILDCKNEDCQRQYRGVPELPDSLCGACREHFQEVRRLLELLHIPHRVNPFMVRGLDYYTRTTFELITGDLGAQSAVGAGGRYDGLVGRLGGPARMPGIGFALGMDRLVLLMSRVAGAVELSGCDLFIAGIGETALTMAFRLSKLCRDAGYRTSMDAAGRSLKNQMKQAGRRKAGHTLIIGDEEIAGGAAILRDMSTRQQVEIPLSTDLAVCLSALEKHLGRV